MQDVWDQRVALAQKRFNTRLEVSSHGWGDNRIGVGVWARTWTWGDLIADVCFHAHVKIDEPRTPGGIRTAIETAMNRVSEACTRAALIYPDQIPCQGVGLDADGNIEILLSSWSDKQAREHQQKVGYTRADFAPVPADNLPQMGGGAAYLDAVVDLIRTADGPEGLMFDWRDDLNSHALRRYIRDVRPLLWQYDACPRVRAFSDVRVSAVGQHKLGLAVLCPDGHAAARMAAQKISETRSAFEMSAPDMPEGYDAYVRPAPLPDFNEDM